MAGSRASPLCATTLPMHEAATSASRGRYYLNSCASTVNPFVFGSDRDEEEEATWLKKTEISKMKGQGLNCSKNANLMAVNLRYIAYAMKEGTVRVINQNGKNMFKIANTTKATIIDMTMLGCGTTSAVKPEATSFLICLDTARHVSIFDLNTQKSILEVVFDSGDPPQLIIAHPSQPDLFVTVCRAHATVWSLSRLLEAPSSQAPPGAERGASECSFRLVTNDLIASASCQAILPSWTSEHAESDPAEIRDVAISLSGQCLVAVTRDHIVTWQLPNNSIGTDQAYLKLIQLQSLAGEPPFVEGFGSVRIVGNGGLEKQGGTPINGANEVLVVCSSDGCDLLAYEFIPSHESSPISSLLQSVRIIPEGRQEIIRHNLNTITYDCLVLTFNLSTLVLVLPLALDWRGGPNCPFPYAQRLPIEEPAHQLSAMTGKSFNTPGHTLFIYRAHNFTRPKDGLTGCNIVVDEVQSWLVDRHHTVAYAPDDVSHETAGSSSDVRAGDQNVAAGDSLMPPGESLFSLPLDPRDLAAADSGSFGAASSTHLTTSLGTNAGGSPLAPAQHRTRGGFIAMDTRGVAATPYEDPVETSDPVFNELTKQARDSLEPSSQGETEDSKHGASEQRKASSLGNRKGASAAGPSEVPRVIRQRGEELPREASEGEGGFNLGLTAPAATDGEVETDRKHDGKKESCDWGLLKQCAASFVKGLERRREEMAEKILVEVAEALKQSGANRSGEREMLDQALVKVREAREAQVVGEKNLTAAVRKATDNWLESSSVTVAAVLQKELSKISDGVASTLAQQLSQSRRFCDAIARGVQRTGGMATKQALESLRPQKQLQETVGASLAEALQEALGPVFRKELRAHLEEELCPLIEQRVGEMMSSLKDKMGDWLDGIAEQHEQAAQRLGGDLAPIVAKELRDAERIMSQRCSDSSTANHSPEGGLSEEQLDEVCSCMQAEVVAPLHARIRDLTTQVQTLRAEAAQLEARWRALALERSSPPVPSITPPMPMDDAEAEEAKIPVLQQLFQEGKAEDAFVTAMNFQATAKHVDFLSKVCGFVDCKEDWLEGEGAGCPLPMPVIMLLMLSLAKQLEAKGLQSDEEESKMKWIEELWLAFDPSDKSVAGNAHTTCVQLTEVLERTAEGDGCKLKVPLMKLVRSVRNAARLMEKK